MLSWNVLRWNGLIDFILPQISMLTEWDTAKIEVNGAHELSTLGVLRCPERSETGGQLDFFWRASRWIRKAANSGCLRWLRWLQSSGFDGFDGLASSGVDRSGNDDDAACFVDLDGSTKEHQCERPPVAQVVGFTKIGDFLKTDAQNPTTPRETAGSRSPRRVDKIDGQRVEGLSWIKWMVNELKDSPVSEETAEAERHTQDAWCGTITKDGYDGVGGGVDGTRGR